MFRGALILACGLVLASAAPALWAGVEPPKLGRPRPAPPTAPDIPPLPPALYDPTLVVGGDDVRARKIETRLAVDVHVNGQGPFKFIVDSGADTSAVGLRIARNLQLPMADTPVIVNGMTARHIVDRVRVDTLTVGPSTIRNLELPALRELDLGGDGMLGIDALVQQRLLMDFEKRVIRVEDARVPVRRVPGEIVITARRQRGQLILTAVKAAGLPLDAIIDTGSEVTIGNLALRDRLMRGNRNKFTTVSIVGVTGVAMDVQLARIGELQLGPVTLRDVPMAFADVPPFRMFGLANEPALMLGTDILEQFKQVSLDFRARKVRFQLRKCEAFVTIATVPENITRIRGNSPEVCRT
jgi:predicted aspartyl protease